VLFRNRTCSPACLSSRMRLKSLGTRESVFAMWHRGIASRCCLPAGFMSWRTTTRSDEKRIRSPFSQSRQKRQPSLFSLLLTRYFVFTIILYLSYETLSNGLEAGRPHSRPTEMSLQSIKTSNRSNEWSQYAIAAFQVTRPPSEASGHASGIVKRLRPFSDGANAKDKAD
jgi:hypothetical protein